MSGSTLSASLTGSPPSRSTAATSSRTAALPASTTGTDQSVPASAAALCRSTEASPPSVPPTSRTTSGAISPQGGQRGVVQPAGGDVHDPGAGRQRRPVAGLGADQLLVADDGQPQPAARRSNRRGTGRRRTRRSPRGRRPRRRRAWSAPARWPSSFAAGTLDQRRLGVRGADVDADDVHERTQTGLGGAGGELVEAERLDRAERAGAVHAALGGPGGAPGEHLGGEPVGLRPGQLHAADQVAGGVAHLGHRVGAGALERWPSTAPRPTRLPTNPATCRARRSAPGSRPVEPGERRQPVRPRRQRTEPVEVDADLAQRRRQPGQRQVLGAADRQAPAHPAARLEPPHAPARRPRAPAVRR